MLRKLQVAKLEPGMFVSNIPVSWFAHPFWRTSFRIRDERDIERLVEAGVQEVLIDTQRGADIPIVKKKPVLPDQERFAELDQRIQQQLTKRRQAVRNTTSLADERWRVQFLAQDAVGMVQGLMEEVRLGHKLDIHSTEPVIEKMIDSVRRHPDALIPLLQLKEHDNYSYQHSISVAAMVMALGTTLQLDEEKLLRAAQGALLQDVGTARISERILNKATPLTDLEYLHVRSHVEQSLAVLESSFGSSDLMLQVVTQHHERLDGTGYPHRLLGASVSPLAQIAAIVDVYDALTSDRPYHRRVEPAVALRQIYSLAGTQFSEDLVQAFVRTLGLYPVGSLVRLDNDTLAVVIEQHRDNLSKPVVRVIFNTRNQTYLQPQVLDLARRFEVPAIVGVESWQQWNIDARRWRPT
jgi:HD-GYP domain-containing protein (c-di-GMP phosphodiesterase class II)